jgi:DNA (cytosine-5)-methyltransferase 1
MNDPIAAGNILFESHPPAHFKNLRSAFLSTSWQRGSGPIPPKLSFCLAATSGRHTGTDWSRTYIPYIDEVRRLTPLECERLQGFPAHWTKLHLENIGVEKSDSLRYHALGNAVSVSVVKWIAKRIHDQLDDTQKSGNKLSFLTESLEIWPGLHGSKMISNKLSIALESNTKITWPHAGILWENEFVANNTYPSLCKPIHSDLIELVLRRVDSQNRHWVPHLRSALERLSGRSLQKNKDVNIQLQKELFVQELAECV